MENEIKKGLRWSISVSFGSFVISKMTGIERYLFLIEVAFIFGILSVYFMIFVPFGEPRREKTEVHLSKIIEPLKNRNFLFFFLLLEFLFLVVPL